LFTFVKLLYWASFFLLYALTVEILFAYSKKKFRKKYYFYRLYFSSINNKNKMKQLSLDAFTLKMIAVISMIVHHTTVVLWEIFPISVHLPLYAIRGVTFPIMAFFIVEGFRRTSNIKKYMGRLLVFALIAQVPYMLASNLFMPNIIFTILLGLICLALYEKLYIQKQKHEIFILLFILIILISSSFEGGLFGPILIFLFHIIKDEKKRRTIPLIFFGCVMLLMNLVFKILAAVSTIPEVQEIIAELLAEFPAGYIQLELMLAEYWVFSLGAFAIIPLLRAYNGQLGRRAKYLFYVFYPVHWLILALIAFALGLNDFTIKSMF